MPIVGKENHQEVEEENTDLNEPKKRFYKRNTVQDSTKVRMSTKKTTEENSSD